MPAWNDFENLSQLLPRLVRLNGLAEVIVVDASPDSATETLTPDPRVTYLRAPEPNRGAQMNLGASQASGEVLIFLHADAILRSDHLIALPSAMRDAEVVGGAFYRKFDARHPRLHGLEKLARYFTRHGGTLFGDQSVFVRRDAFLALGGFAPIPLMEDMEFSRRLRRHGRIAVLDPPMETSGRRHLRRGAWRTSIENGLFILLYGCGCSPHFLHRLYYRQQTAPNESKEAPLLEASLEESGRR